MHQNMKRINRKLEYGSCGSLLGILNIIIWNHATLIGTDKIIKSLTDRPNEIFLRVSVKKLYALHRIKEILNSHFDSTDKKEAFFILTLAVIKEKVSWVGGDEPIKDRKKRWLHKEHLWGSDLFEPWLLEHPVSLGHTVFLKQQGDSQSMDSRSLRTQRGQEQCAPPASWRSYTLPPKLGFGPNDLMWYT